MLREVQGTPRAFSFVSLPAVTEVHISGSQAEAKISICEELQGAGFWNW